MTHDLRCSVAEEALHCLHMRATIAGDSDADACLPCRQWSGAAGFLGRGYRFRSGHADGVASHGGSGVGVAKAEEGGLPHHPGQGGPTAIPFGRSRILKRLITMLVLLAARNARPRPLPLPAESLDCPALTWLSAALPCITQSFLDGGSLLPTASAPAAGSSSDASSQPKAPKPSPERTSTFEEGPDVRTLALPGALLFVGGLGALTFFSAELTGFMEANFVKDSTVLGVGQETDYVKFDFVPKRTITNRGGTKVSSMDAQFSNPECPLIPRQTAP